MRACDSSGGHPLLGFYPRAMTQCGALPFYPNADFCAYPSGLNPSHMVAGYYRRACTSVAGKTIGPGETQGRRKTDYHNRDRMSSPLCYDKSVTDKPDVTAGLKALSGPVPGDVPSPINEPENEKPRDTIAQKTCPKCPGSPAMSATAVIGIIPAMNDERFGNIEKISRTAGFPVRVYECPQCHLVELYRQE